MAKREGYRGPRFTGRQHVNQHHRRVWVPAVPSWEKEFCCKTGSFTTWKEFLKAKEQTRFADKILEWNDSAAEEAFIKAKKLYFARINGLEYATCNDQRYSMLHDPDLYIDRICWDGHDDDQEKSELLRELESAAAARKFYDHDDAEQEEEEDEVDLGRRIRIEDIIATGWEQEEVYFSRSKCLTGLIIGDD